MSSRRPLCRRCLFISLRMFNARRCNISRFQRLIKQNIMELIITFNENNEDLEKIAIK